MVLDAWIVKNKSSIIFCNMFGKKGSQEGDFLKAMYFKIKSYRC